MKAALALITLAVITVSEGSVIRVSSRAILNAGYVGAGDRLLYRLYDYQPDFLNSVQYRDVVFRDNLTTRISAIQAYEVGVTQWASAYIVQGGIGQANVTVRFTSASGNGYNFLLEIWRH